MKNRKLIAIDLDGSLVANAAPLPSSFSLTILNQLIDLGHLIVIASGRPFLAVKDVADQFKKPMPFVCYNGAMVFDPNSYLKDYAYYFKKGEILEIYQKIKDVLFSFMVGNQDKIIEDYPNPYLERFFYHEGNQKIIGDLADIPEKNYLCAFEFVPKGDNEEKIKKIISSYPHIAYRKWADGECYSELYFPHSDKGEAIKALAKAYGINQKDVIAFGDSGNDFGLLDFAGTPFAMSNYISPKLVSFPKTKKSCAEDGVAFTLKELFSL